MDLIPEKCGKEGEKPLDMNNFYMYMPGGCYRQSDLFEDKVQIMAAIDELLAGEFAALDAASIMHVIGTVHGMIKQAIAEGVFLDQKESFGQKIDMMNREIEKLRPLFKRLVEMGFDPMILRR